MPKILFIFKISFVYISPMNNNFGRFLLSINLIDGYFNYSIGFFDGCWWNNYLKKITRLKACNEIRRVGAKKNYEGSIGKRIVKNILHIILSTFFCH